MNFNYIDKFDYIDKFGYIDVSIIIKLIQKIFYKLYLLSLAKSSILKDQLSLLKTKRCQKLKVNLKPLTI